MQLSVPGSYSHLDVYKRQVLEGVKSLAALKPYKVKVTSNELQVEDSFVYGMVSNTESVGGMRGLAGTGVDLQDGLFEVTLIKEIKNPMEVQPVSYTHLDVYKRQAGNERSSSKNPDSRK